MHLFQVFHATLLLGCLLTPTLAQLEKFDSFSDNLSKDNIRIKVSNDHEMMEQDFMEPETVLPHLEQLTTSSTTVSTLTTIFNNPDASEEVEDAITTTKPHQHIFEMLMASSRDETNFSVEPSMLISNKDVDYQEEGGGSQFYQSLKSGLAETTRGMPDDDATTPDDSENETNDYDEKNQTLTTLAPSTLPTHRKPKPKYIYKMSPEEFLKTFVEDTHLRTPVAALVDRKTNSLIKSKRLWRAALRPNTPLDIVLVSYDSAGEKELIYKVLKILIDFCSLIDR